MITRKEWERIKTKGIQKHDAGLAAPDSKIWWVSIGRRSCSFCERWAKYEYNKDGDLCPNCPLGKNPCCDEWIIIQRMYHMEDSSWDDTVFRVNETALLEKIKALEYEDLPEVKKAMNKKGQNHDRA